MYCVLIPAYGRQYSSKEEAVSDWDSGKDFKILDGPYCSIRDKEELIKQFNILSIRYGQGLYHKVA